MEEEGSGAGILRSGMRLYLVRHAEAARGKPDELRPLTDAGRSQARAVGQSLRASGVLPDAILTSPLLRARETGLLIGQELGVASAADDRLAPGATPRTVTEAVAGRGETVIVVGHQPDCSRIAAALTGGPPPEFPPARAVAIALER
jgi:phosphohistidine phosphatase